MRMRPQGIRVTQPELRDAQKVDLDFLFAAAGEVEIEAGLDLGEIASFRWRWWTEESIVAQFRRASVRKRC
jgi:hypothetical protein